MGVAIINQQKGGEELHHYHVLVGELSHRNPQLPQPPIILLYDSLNKRICKEKLFTAIRANSSGALTLE